ncbi:XRE family transcriptional regulator [Lachnospiraceae bacterium AM48-27BH]|nr:XRE family transcriptional regulator [Lachnospiraceae bacterium AM48-27BH]
MEIDVMKMAEKLVALRGEKKQDEVAEELGISRSALCMYETGRRVPRDPLKARIAKYYQKSIPFIFFNEKEHETCTNK